MLWLLIMINTKIRRYLNMHRIAAFCALLFLVVLSVAHPLSAQSLTEGYSADQQLQRGMLIQFKKNDTTKVEPVSQSNIDQLHGVVVDANDAPVTLSAEGQKVFVATKGKYDVLVTNQNGSIAIGDFITVSALDGIGMKASEREPVIIGRALAAFDGKQNVIGTAELTDNTNTKQPVNIARLQVDVGVSRNPLLRATEPNLPGFLKKASEAIAGKPVSTTRVYIAVAVFVLSTVVSAVLMYGGIRSGIISIGRNPLSKKSIIRSMLQVVIVGITIFITGIFGVYLLLKI